MTRRKPMRRADRAEETKDGSLRQRALLIIELHGEMSADALASALGVPRRTAVNIISSLVGARKIEPVPVRGGRRRYRIARARYERPPEGRIDIAGPVYARGYRWGSGPI